MDDEPRGMHPIVPILVLIIVILVAVLAFQAGRQHGGGDKPENATETPNVVAKTDDEPNDRFELADIEAAEPEPVAVKPGEVIRRETLKNEGVRLVEPAPVADANRERLKKVVEEQKVYDSLLRWTMYGKVEDKRWSARTILNMSYAAEARLIRTVEKNDGDEIVVLYDFQSLNMIEVLCDVERVKLDFMKNVTPILGKGIDTATTWLAPVFDFIKPGSSTATKIVGRGIPMMTEVFAESLATRGYKGMAELLERLKISDKKGRVKVFGMVDSLQGKRVRITHRNGAVESIEPIGCELSETERNLCANLGVLADYHIMPQLDISDGSTWKVRADHFSNMLDPSMRGLPAGTLDITRKATAEDNGRKFATLEITRGTIELDSSDTKTSRIGKCMPRGTMNYDLEDGFVQSATLTAEISIDRMSKKHLLFESRFKSNPSVEIEYECSKGTENVLRVPESWKGVTLDPAMFPAGLLP